MIAYLVMEAIEDGKATSAEVIAHLCSDRTLRTDDVEVLAVVRRIADVFGRDEKVLRSTQTLGGDENDEKAIGSTDTLGEVVRSTDTLGGDENEEKVLRSTKTLGEGTRSEGILRDVIGGADLTESGP